MTITIPSWIITTLFYLWAGACVAVVSAMMGSAFCFFVRKALNMRNAAILASAFLTFRKQTAEEWTLSQVKVLLTNLRKERPQNFYELLEQLDLVDKP